MGKKSLKKRIIVAVPGIVSLPILLLSIWGSGCTGEQDLLTTGFNCESPLHIDHLTCGTTTQGASSIASFVSPNQG
jgi:hypothetical protein|tara:strand:+ start:304 stop:531 length:228 start_codon:yes stop_codon:yes gene_type:complete